MAVPDPHALSMPLLADPRCAAHVRSLLTSRWQPGVDPSALARFVERSVGALVFVAVHHGNFPSLEYMAAALRDRGRPVVAVYLRGEAPTDTFDAVLCCDGSLAQLAEIVAVLPASSVYVQAHGRWSLLGQFVAAVRPDLRVIQEVWDWMDAFVEPRHEQAFVDDGLFTAPELAMIRGAEAWVRTGSAGFVHKHGGAALDAVVADAKVPEVRIIPAPPRAWMRSPAAPPVGPVRLVHAGQIKPSTSSRQVFGDLHLLPTIGALTHQGMHVTAYAAAHLGSLDAALGEYVAHAAADPRFRIEPRLPVRRLVDALHGQHHFGLLLYPFDADLRVGQRHLQTALASKLFAYIAAGLPVLVSPELAYMAALVRTHGIGIVVEREAIATLAQRLAEVDHGALRAAVARAQPELCIERQLPAVLRLVDGAP